MLKLPCILFALSILLCNCRHSTCPAYASVDHKVKKSYSKAKHKKLKRKNDALFTKEQLSVIRSGKKAARLARKNKEKKS